MNTAAPKDQRALVAVDLGAESCRVSLLRWIKNKPDNNPTLTLVYRFGNAPCKRGDHLYWDLAMIEAGIDDGMRKCAEIAVEGIRSVAVDGWAVDYVRVDDNGHALGDPFCYRDERTIRAMDTLHAAFGMARLRELSGIQIARLNTLYQLVADRQLGLAPGHRWLNLPEYMLFRWGGAPVAEYTNATHTGMVDLYSREWSREILDAAKLNSPAQIVPPGTIIGKLTGPLAALPAFKDTVLLAPACHDTASAIAGIPATGNDWAYISAGTWSLIGTVIAQPRNNAATAEENFTNLGAVGTRICFHASVNGMWLLRQCMETWALKTRTKAGRVWDLPELIAAAEKAPKPDSLLNVDDEDLLLPGDMPQRINAQRARQNLPPLDEHADNAPAFANLIFHSLAARYATALDRVAFHSGKTLKRVFIVGGASQNEYLNRLTHQATGLEILRGAPESSTIGNFAVQLAALEGSRDAVTGAYAEKVSSWAALLIESQRTSQ
jgi:rhamnulokinase